MALSVGDTLFFSERSHRNKDTEILRFGPWTRTTFRKDVFYDNIDAVGDGVNDRPRRTDKTFQWNNPDWYYDFATERVVAPKYPNSSSPVVIKPQGGAALSVILPDTVTGLKEANGVYGLEQIRYPDALGVGVDCIIAPAPSGVAKLAKIQPSMTPMSISFEVSGNTSYLLNAQCTAFQDGKSVVVPHELTIAGGKQYLVKHVPDLTDWVGDIYVDVLFDFARIDVENTNTSRSTNAVGLTWDTHRKVTVSNGANSPTNAATFTLSANRGANDSLGKTVYSDARCWWSFDTSSLAGKQVQLSSLNITAASRIGAPTDTLVAAVRSLASTAGTQMVQSDWDMTAKMGSDATQPLSDADRLNQGDYDLTVGVEQGQLLNLNDAIGPVINTMGSTRFVLMLKPVLNPAFNPPQNTVNQVVLNNNAAPQPHLVVDAIDAPTFAPRAGGAPRPKRFGRVPGKDFRIGFKKAGHNRTRISASAATFPPPLPWVTPFLQANWQDEAGIGLSLLSNGGMTPVFTNPGLRFDLIDNIIGQSASIGSLTIGTEYTTKADVQLEFTPTFGPQATQQVILAYGDLGATGTAYAAVVSMSGATQNVAIARFVNGAVSAILASIALPAGLRGAWLKVQDSGANASVQFRYTTVANPTAVDWVLNPSLDLTDPNPVGAGLPLLALGLSSTSLAPSAADTLTLDKYTLTNDASL